MFGGVAVAYLLLMLFLHCRCMLRANFYKKQGGAVYPGASKLIFGNELDVLEYVDAAKKSPEPLDGLYRWLCDNFMTKIGRPGEHFDGAQFPLIFVNKLTVPTILLSDPEAVKDLYTTYNKLADKDGEAEMKFKELIGSSFIFSKNDEAWKAKRKACSHAFYKDRLINMLDTVKMKCEEYCEQYLAEIRASPNKETTVDFARLFERILARSIIHIMFGEDISNETFKIKVKDAQGVWIEKDVTIPEAVEDLISQVGITFLTKMKNPVNWIGRYTCKFFDWSEYYGHFAQNCKNAREFVWSYVLKRKNGEIKSTVG